MFLDPKFNRQTLRSSFVPMPMNDTDKTQSNLTKEAVNLDVPKQWLLARYHDESYINVEYANMQAVSWYDVIGAKMPFINPQSALLLGWNFLVEAAIIFNLCEIPIAVFLTENVYISEFTTPAGIAINAIFVVVLFVHTFLVRPITGYSISGRLVSSFKRTFQQYAKLQLWLNVIAWITLLVYAIANNAKFVYVKFLFYLYCYSLMIVDDQISNKLELKRLRYAGYRLIRLVAILLFAVLWLSCVYFAIDYRFYLEKNQYYPVNLWLTNSVCSQYYGGYFIDLVAVYPWYVWLNYAFYWTLQSITGVGYGDMTPRNPPEVVYCNLVVLFMTIAYAFFINSVWEIIAEVNQTGDSQAAHFKLLRVYQKKYKLKQDMVNRLGSYIYDIWTHGKSQQAEENIKDSLSEDLRGELLVIRQKKFFSAIPLFSQMSERSEDHSQLFQQWAYHLTETKHGKQQIIFTAGDPPSNMYSVLIGEVTLCYPNSKIMIKLKKGMSFGIADFLADRQASYTASAKTFCKITSLSREAFIESLKYRGEVYQVYMQQVENLQRNKQHSITGEDCWVCSNPDHPTHLCQEYFSWMFQLRNPQMVVEKWHKIERRDQSTKNHGRKFFNRRKAGRGKKMMRGRAFEAVQVDCVHYYQKYRSIYSL